MIGVSKYALSGGGVFRDWQVHTAAQPARRVRGDGQTVVGKATVLRVEGTGSSSSIACSKEASSVWPCSKRKLCHKY